MTLAEFRAWLSGYVASFKDGVPNLDQWEEVGRKLATVRESSLPSTTPLRDIYGPYTGPVMPFWQYPISTC